MKKIVFQNFLKIYIAAIISTIGTYMWGKKQLKYGPSPFHFWLKNFELCAFVHNFERDRWGRRFSSMQKMLQMLSKVSKALFSRFMSMTQIVIFKGTLSDSDVCIE